MRIRTKISLDVGAAVNGQYASCFIKVAREHISDVRYSELIAKSVV